MKLLIIRHGDPDYTVDSLTEKGWREAEYLAGRLEKMKIDEFYVSPLGRAKDTASCTMKKLGKEAKVCPWLEEFAYARIQRPDVADRDMIVWDWLPQDRYKEDRFLDQGAWALPEVMEEGKVREKYDKVIADFDRFLADHGYEREGMTYRAARPNRDTIALFCHFGLECVLLSHLLNISPMMLWHGFCAAPTSVTTVVTQERRKGIAEFRVTGFGDISHLYEQKEEPSFSARFCECYDDREAMGERQD